MRIVLDAERLRVELIAARERAKQAMALLREEERRWFGDAE